LLELCKPSAANERDDRGRAAADNGDADQRENEIFNHGGTSLTDAAAPAGHSGRRRGHPNRDTPAAASSTATCSTDISSILQARTCINRTRIPAPSMKRGRAAVSLTGSSRCGEGPPEGVAVGEAGENRLDHFAFAQP